MSNCWANYINCICLKGQRYVDGITNRVQPMISLSSAAYESRSGIGHPRFDWFTQGWSLCFGAFRMRVHGPRVSGWASIVLSFLQPTECPADVSATNGWLRTLINVLPYIDLTWRDCALFCTTACGRTSSTLIIWKLWPKSAVFYASKCLTSMSSTTVCVTISHTSCGYNRVISLPIDFSWIFGVFRKNLYAIAAGCPGASSVSSSFIFTIGHLQLQTITWGLGVSGEVGNDGEHRNVPARADFASIWLESIDCVGKFDHISGGGPHQ